MKFLSNIFHGYTIFVFMLGVGFGVLLCWLISSIKDFFKSVFKN